MIKDALIALAKSKVSQIAAKTNKSEDEILSAIKKGKDGGYAMARQLGITKEVAKQMYEKFGHLADKIPIVGRAVLDSEFSKAMSQLDDEPQPNREHRRAEKKKTGGFDRNKYKRV